MRTLIILILSLLVITSADLYAVTPTTHSNMPVRNMQSKKKKKQNRNTPRLKKRDPKEKNKYIEEQNRIQKERQKESQEEIEIINRHYQEEQSLSGIPFGEGSDEKTTFDLSDKTFTEVRGIIRQYLKEILNDPSRACRFVNAAINVDKNRITMNTGVFNSEDPTINISMMVYYNDTVQFEPDRIINYSIIINSQVTDLIQFDEQEKKGIKINHPSSKADEKTDNMKLISVSLYKEDEELIERNRIKKMWMNSNKRDQ